MFSIYTAARSHKSASRGKGVLPATDDADESLVVLYNVVLEIINGVSSVKKSSTAVLDFPSTNVKDFKFVDDDDMMILLSHSGKSHATSEN